ncbi:MAG: flagellar basal-body rod protein FlgF [Alphaproteobacteria bacterium]|nr:flagellar basal-body rod protein FlgF [Alphaproteobacteria bacterium]
METTSMIALSRQSGLRRQMEVIANNIANVNTTGFKGEKMMFVDHVIRSKSGERTLPEKFHFTRDVATVRDITDGEIQSTGNALDVAINGAGYFVVQTPEGERYTRNGRFQLDQSGRLVTQQGHAVLSDGGAITFGQRDQTIDIAADGTISAESGRLGKLRVVTFDNEMRLRQSGDTLLRTDDAPRNAEKPRVVQGAIEGSNIKPVIEITHMIEVQRSYESLARFIDREDERVKSMMRAFADIAA